MGNNINLWPGAPRKIAPPETDQNAAFQQPTSCRERAYLFRQLAEFLLKVDLALVCRPANMNCYAAG